MIAQEMGALAMMEKMTRIWLPEGTPRDNVWFGMKNFWFEFRAVIGEETQFEYHDQIAMWMLYSTATFPTEDEEPGFKFYGYMGCLSFDDERGLFMASEANQPATPYSNQKRTSFTVKWLPYFRRGLWLFGMPIETSAHERAEWIQGFTEDEIEAWNLKM